MSILVPRRRFDPSVLEMMDQSGHEPEILRDDLKNLRVINKYFGGLSVIRRQIIPLLRRVKGSPIEILDLATGSGDHPAALVRLARQLGLGIKITALDINPVMLEYAREHTRQFGEITLVRGDILQPDFNDQSFDIVLCSLALHHFSQPDAVRIVATMNRLSRVGFIVNDLNRSWLGAWTAWLYTHVTTRNTMTLNDSFLSVLRAFTPSELRSIALEAGVAHPSITKQPLFRLLLTGTR